MCVHRGESEYKTILTTEVLLLVDFVRCECNQEVTCLNILGPRGVRITEMFK